MEQKVPLLLHVVWTEPVSLDPENKLRLAREPGRLGCSSPPSCLHHPLVGISTHALSPILLIKPQSARDPVRGK